MSNLNTANSEVMMARKALRDAGWVDIPTATEARRMIDEIRASGDDSLNGETLTLAEIRALRALAACQD